MFKLSGKTITQHHVLIQFLSTIYNKHMEMNESRTVVCVVKEIRDILMREYSIIVIIS